ncbi:siderophore receptor [Xanthomonas sp. GW]|uniref:TonB-dependent siderophore receptor n=1 Tax=Xanthomonas sp. GW TaxID=2724121 RepID=UPI0016399DF5|nr:TonB-dependent receptor [Xanthomonas sp. GW]QNH22989.1 siderophore receptor [Xanthomonas sp. GW]
MSCPSALAAHVLPCRFHRGVRLAALAAALLLACNAYAEDTETETDQATELDAVSVTAARVHANAGALGERNIQDTPFAIQVLDREDLDKRQVVSLGDAFFNDPSVVTQVGAYSSGWSSPIINRGLGLSYDSYRVNGLQVSSWGSEWPLEAMEQVELLKGPAGFLYGFGQPGGLVNYLTKKPTDDTTLSARLGWRSDAVASAQLDAGGRFGNQDMFGYRLNVFREKGETYNGGEVDRKVVSAALDARLSDRLTWTADLVYQSRQLSEEAPQYYFIGLSAVPRAIGGDADRSVTGSYYDTRSRLLSTGLEWRFAEGWKASLNYGVTTSWNDVNKIFAYIDDANGDYDVNAYELGGRSEWKLVQLMLQGNFATGPLRHQLVAGASRQDATGWDRPYVWQTIGRGNLYDWQGMTHYSSASRVMTRSSETLQKALFVSDTIAFAPGWSLLAGWRYNDYEQIGTYHTYPVTPTYALMYKPADAVTLYASYIESLEAGGRVGDDYINAGQVLDPTISKQYEIGAKIAYPRWNANATAFRLQRGASIDRITATGKYLEQDGVTLYDGIELSGDYRLTEQLSVGGGATWLDPRYDKLSPDNAADQGHRVSFAARWQGVVHVDYAFPGIDGLSVYAALRYFGDAWYDSANTLKLPDYTLANLGAGYRMRMHGHPLTWRASIDNLTDRKYWITNSMGAPRTYALSVQFEL